MVKVQDKDLKVLTMKRGQKTGIIFSVRAKKRKITIKTDQNQNNIESL